MSTRVSIFQDIKGRLSALRRRLLAIRISAQGQLLAAFGVTLAVVALASDLLFRFDSTGRTIIIALYILALAGFGAWFVLRPFLQRMGLLLWSDDFALASYVGSFFPNVRDRLMNLLQMHDEASAHSYYSPELIDASFDDLAQDLKEVDFLQTADSSPAKRSRQILMFSLMICAVPFLLTPGSFNDSLFRFVHFREEFVIPSRVVFDLSPGNSEIIKGQDVTLRVRVQTDEHPATTSLHLRWKPEGQAEYEDETLEADTAGVYTKTLSNVRLSTDYFAEYLGEQSSVFRLTVIDRPVIRSFQVRIDPPAYSRLPSQVLDDFVGDVAALAGSRISLSGSASKDLARGRLMFRPDSVIPLAVRGAQFSARFPLLRETPYVLELTDHEQLVNANPVSYQLQILPDESPSVAILQPDLSIDVAGVSTLPLLLHLKDDFGFSRLRLGYRLAQSRYEPVGDQFRFIDLPLTAKNTVVQDLPYAWDLTPLHLAPEDLVEYFVEVFDNDNIRGPKSGVSSLHRLRLPSLEEVFTDLDTGHKEAIEEIAQAVEETKELKEKIDAINEDLKKNKDPDWQQQKNMEEAAKRYNELHERMEDVRKKLDDMVGQMNQQNILSPETMEKYLELQQLMEQIDSAELQNALKQLQQAMQSVNREQLQQALEKVSFSEERFRESIERTLNLLKRIQIEQKLDEVKKRAEELVDEQQDLAKATDQDSSRSDALAKKQEDLKKKLDNLQDAARDVQNRMEEFFTEMPEQAMEQATQKLEESRAAENMTKSAQQLRSGQKQQSGMTQKEITKNLQSFSNEMGQIQQEMLQQQQQYVMNALRRATNDLLELSKKEERLKEESRDAPANSSQLRQNAQEQLGTMNDLSNVIEGLNQVAQRSFAVTPEMAKAIGEALARMRAAMNSLDMRSGLMASQEQEKAMAALNRAAIEVQRALQAAMQAGGQGGGGLLQQLQMMAGQQMSINMRTQSMQDAARMAVEQEALRKSLEQLNKEAQASTDKERILGDLERIAAEMKEVVRNLEQNDVGQETIRRQERILSRLLDAARSTQERDFEKRRKSTTGTPLARKSPGELDPSTLEGRNRLRDDLLKAIEQGYTKDYQELIRKYFDELQKVEENRK